MSERPYGVAFVFSLDRNGNREYVLIFSIQLVTNNMGMPVMVGPSGVCCSIFFGDRYGLDFF